LPGRCCCSRPTPTQPPTRKTVAPAHAYFTPTPRATGRKVDRPVFGGHGVELLVTESQEEFDEIRDALDQEIKPRGLIEKMFTADIAYLLWDILRLRRCKARIIDSERRPALASLLDRLFGVPEEYQRSELVFNPTRGEELAEQWYTDQAAKKQVFHLLRKFQLDSSAIEAEAVRRCAADLEKIDRMLAAAESRRNRALRQIFEYRQGFARRLRDASERVIDGKAIEVDHAGGKTRSAAA
jgi:hypothetical protein